MRNTFMLDILIDQFIMININTNNSILHVVETSRKNGQIFWKGMTRQDLSIQNHRKESIKSIQSQRQTMSKNDMTNKEH